MTQGALHQLIDPRGDAEELKTVRYTEAVLGLPGRTHGGALIATLVLASDLTGPVRLHGRFRRPVPIETPVEARRRTIGGAGGQRLELLVNGKAYVSAEIEPHDAPRIMPPPAKQSGTLAPHMRCFVCGRRRPDGLRATFYFDDADAALWCTWRAVEDCVTASGQLSPLAVTALLDDAATWLGTLTTGHTVVTREFDLVLRLPLARLIELRVGGRLDMVSLDASGKNGRATVSLSDDSGSVHACGHISFSAAPEFTEAAAQALTAAGVPSEIVARIYSAAADRDRGDT